MRMFALAIVWAFLGACLLRLFQLGWDSKVAVMVVATYGGLFVAAYLREWKDRVLAMLADSEGEEEGDM